MNQTANPRSETSSSARWFTVWVLFALNLMNFFDRAILAALTEPIRKEWHLSDTQVGWLGTAFTFIYAAAGLPLGRLADRMKRTWLLGLGAAVWSVLTAASGLATGYWSMFATRLGVGIGEATCAPAANSLIGDLFEPARRGRALAIFMLGLPAGMFLSFITTGPIAQAHGWRAPFYIACVPGLILAALTLFLHEPSRGAAEAARQNPSASGSAYARVLRIPAMWWIIVSGALYNFNAYAVGSFLTAFLMRGHHLDLKKATQFSAVVLGGVTAVGLLVGGWAADRVHHKRANGRLLLAGSGLIVTSLFTFLALQQRAGATLPFMIYMCVGMLFAYFYYAPVYATIHDLIEPQLRGSAMAIYFFGMYVLGASLGPVGTGALSDFFARRSMAAAGATEITEAFKATGLHAAMYAIPLLALLAAGTLFAAATAVGRHRAPAA
jgi:MFS family permease